METAITGNQIRAARILAGIDQRELAKAADLPVQTISRMEASGATPIVSRPSTITAVLAALGSHRVALAPNCIIHALVVADRPKRKSPKSKTRLDANRSGLAADAASVHPASSNQVYLR